MEEGSWDLLACKAHSCSDMQVQVLHDCWFWDHKNAVNWLLSAHPFLTHFIIVSTSQPQSMASGCSYT